MNRKEDRGFAIGLQRKSSGAPHGHRMHGIEHRTVGLSVDWRPLVWPVNACEVTRPLAQTRYSEYLILFTILSAIKCEFVIRLAFPIICLLMLEMMLHSQHVVAAEWLIEPSLNLQETHSDNIGLAPRGSERSDWISQIDPGITLTGKGSDLKVNARYQMQNIFYAKDSAMQSTNHLLNTDANARLFDDLLFLDGNAAIRQQNISSLGPLAADNANVTNNRTNIESYSIAPYLKHNFHDIASSELRFTHDAVVTSTAGLSNRQANQVQFDLESGSSFRALGWGMNYNKQRNNYSDETIGFTGSENYSGSLYYPITPHFTLKVTGGYEKFDYLSTGQKPEGPIQTAGFSWTPTQRTNIEASTGHRFFGNTYKLNISQSSRRIVWNLAYNADITTTQSQFQDPATINTATFLNNLWASSIPDDTLRQQAVDAFISNMGLSNSLADPTNYLSNRVFLQKRIQAAAGITGAKNKIMFTIFGMSREAQTPATMDSVLIQANNLESKDKTKQIGGNALWDMQISSRASANIGADASATGRKNYIKSFNVALIRQLQPNLSGTVGLRRTQQHSDQIGGGYQENTVSASLLMKF